MEADRIEQTKGFFVGYSDCIQSVRSLLYPGLAVLSSPFPFPFSRKRPCRTQALHIHTRACSFMQCGPNELGMQMVVMPTLTLTCHHTPAGAPAAQPLPGEYEGVECNGRSRECVLHYHTMRMCARLRRPMWPGDMDKGLLYLLWATVHGCMCK